MNSKKILVLALLFGAFGFNTQLINAQEKSKVYSTKDQKAFQLRIDKSMTDEDLKKDETDAKKFDFEVSFSSVKRNDKKEITAIKIAYKDQDGNSGNYNVAGDSPINTITISKNFDRTGKGFINISSGQTMNAFGDGFAFGGNGMGNMFNDEMFRGLMDGQRFQFDNQEFNFDKLDELKKELMEGAEGEGKSFSKSFIFKDGKMMGNDENMKLEEEKVEEDGTVTKKYSDGNGGTMIIKEKNFNSKDGDANELDKLKKENRIEIEKSIKIENDSKSDLDEIKKELEKTKADLEKLKSDLKSEKGPKGKK